MRSMKEQILTKSNKTKHAGSEIQRDDLRRLFEIQKALFDWTLGVYINKKFYIGIQV